MVFLFLILFGLAVGSFVANWTWRLPRHKKIYDGTSVCDICEKPLSWRDNLPVFSYIVLQGKCRNCRGRISVRYPLIETMTALSFVYTYINLDRITNTLTWPSTLDIVPRLIYYLIIASILVAIFVIDMEHQLIPDKFVFAGILAVLAAFIFAGSPLMFSHLLAGLLAASFLLLVHLLTLGRGMGLGDVKLALFTGLSVGYLNTLSFMFLSFVIGAIVGIILLFLRKAKLKQEIPFGPFMIAGYCLILIWGNLFKYV